ncbi:major facilitator superfamily domain-containing protein [Lentinula edodes]|uniref:major facilitator superfamily domain-containing protein n=1 Tax=Lentinula edodes TaxID=5353 RepID=UPI001E8CF260|nr:major facilitator superfamily domain-containing protein [Lentinula edodes]KAH7870567.1 major facilitator superfamily domain-containing protein [Lentinula edodes]
MNVNQTEDKISISNRSVNVTVTDPGISKPPTDTFSATPPDSDKLANWYTPKDFGLIPIPKRLRYDPDKPFHFGMFLNVLFGVTSTFSVANLYWCQPILIELATNFDVSYDEISKLPTLIQAGYATGLIFISPLGDLVRRRQLLLILIIISASLTIGLSLTHSLRTFQVLSFLTGISSVTPQVLLPLTADLAPPSRRATALSIVFSGLLFGILIARVFSGLIAQFADWRITYYMSIGVQWGLVVVLFWIVPDYPPKNAGKDGHGVENEEGGGKLGYGRIMWTMAKFSVTEPVLIQGCLCNLGSAAAFSSFWVTLTFLLGGEPYNYSTLIIGLFGLIGMVGVALAPLVGRFIDFLVPWQASLVACLGLLLFQIVQVVGNGLNVAAVIIATIGLDVFRQMLETSVAISIFSIAPHARARLNAIYILSLFIGQVIGSSAGTKIFLTYGWRATAAMTLGLTAWALLMLMMRGPGCDRYTWFGFRNSLDGVKGVLNIKAKVRADDENVQGALEAEKDVEKIEGGP